jgi:hypothetical protein
VWRLGGPQPFCWDLCLELWQSSTVLGTPTPMAFGAVMIASQVSDLASVGVLSGRNSDGDRGAGILG